MNVTIEIARGLFAELPTTGALGEPFFCTDTGQLFVWNGTQQVLVNANAIEVDGITISGSPTLGSVLIGQGNGSAVFADPFVQGVYAPGTNVTTGGISSGPINPVLVGAKNPSGLLEDFNLDSSGNLLIAVANASIPVTGTFYPYALGQAVAASSVPVVLTAAQITALTPPAAITNYAEETGGNLATIATNTGKIPALGQALAASSVPVVLTAAQITALTPPAAFNGVVTNAGTFAVQASSAMSGTVPGTAPASTDIIGAIYNSASPAPTSGQTLPLQLDISGALKTVSGGPSSTALVTWNSTNGTLNATQAIYSNSTAYANLMLHSVGTGTISGGAFVVQGCDDNANWQTIPVYSIRQASYIIGNISIPTGAVINSYAIQTFGFSYLRILMTVAFAGAGSLTQSYSLSGASQPVVATNPSVVNQNQATGDITTSLAPLNSLTNNGSLAVTMCAALGTTSLTNNPGGNSTSQALRTPAIFHNASVPATASGNTAVWTPTSGKKFRLMRFQITAQGLSATAATILTISFQDATTGIAIGTYDVLLPATANLVAGITQVSAWVDLGNGYLSSTANNALNANISATVSGATGTFRVNVCGTEE